MLLSQLTMCRQLSIFYLPVGAMLVLLAMMTSVTSAVDVTILPPVKNATTEAALLVCPGLNIEGKAYRPLAETIQKHSELRLWLVLLENFRSDTPTLPELEAAVNMSRDQLHQRGMASDNMMLAGHNLGGKIAAQYGQAHPDLLKGILLMASYLTKGHSLRTFPLPVLTLSGDLDGLNRITRILETFEELETDVAINKTAKYLSPVIVMKGVNHGQFASGDMPPNVKDFDVDPDVTLETAHSMIAGDVNTFLEATLVPAGPLKVNATRGLEKAYNKTRSLLKIFSMVKSYDFNPKLTSYWTLQVQSEIIGENLVDYLTVKNTVVPEENLLMLEPTITNKSGLVVQSYTSVVLPINLDDVAQLPQSPIELQAKMKNQASVRQLLPKVHWDNTTWPCSSFNMVVTEFLLLSSPEYIQQRFQDRGANMYPQNDVMVDDITEWYSTPLDLQYNNDGTLNVTSYVYATPTNYTDKDLAGMVYCKLLSPYRAFEWLTLDTLRRHT